MLRAVDLDEFANAGLARPRRVAPAGPLRPWDPQAGGDHPSAQRLDGEDELVLLGQLLMREGGPEVGIVLTHERQCVLTGRVRQAPIARPPTAPRRQSHGAGARECLRQAPHLALAQAQQLGRAASRVSPLGDPGHDLQSVQFPHRQPNRVRHRPSVGEKRTRLLWRTGHLHLGLTGVVNIRGLIGRRAVVRSTP